MINIKDEFKKLESDIEKLVSFVRYDLERNFLAKDFNLTTKEDFKKFSEKLNKTDFNKYTQLISDEKIKKISNRERKYLSEMEERLETVQDLKKSVVDILDFNIDIKNKINSTVLNKNISIPDTSFISGFQENILIKIKDSGNMAKTLQQVMQIGGPHEGKVSGETLNGFFRIFNNELEMDIVQENYIHHWKKQNLTDDQQKLLCVVQEQVKSLKNINQGIIFMLYTIKGSVSKKILNMADLLYNLENRIDNFSI